MHVRISVFCSDALLTVFLPPLCPLVPAFPPPAASSGLALELPEPFKTGERRVWKRGIVFIS